MTTSYLNQEAVKNAFLSEAAKKPNLKAALSDPLVETIVGTFSHIVMAIDHRNDREANERYLGTATNRSSILAKSEDRQYTARKALASTGTLKAIDKELKYGGLPSGIALISSRAVKYLTSNTITFDGSGVAEDIPVSQIEIEEFVYTVDVTQAFYEVLIPAEYSSRVADIKVYVDDGGGYRPWTLAKRLRNTNAGDYVYDEFYSSSDEYGVRFGTGTIGRVPEAGWKVKLEVSLTNGETTLIAGEKLKLADSSLYSKLEFEVQETIDGGSAQEDIESIRTNSLYYEIFDESYAWDDDYGFLLGRVLPDMTWVQVWGEAHQEEINGGVMSELFKNKIYISAYVKYGDTSDPLVYNPRTSESVLDYTSGNPSKGIKGIPQLNRSFVFVNPVEKTFSITITGKILRSWTLVDAKAALLSYLDGEYGKDSKDRKLQPFKRDIYAGIKDLKIFDTNHEVDVSISGTAVPANKSEFIYLDLAATDAAIVLEYA